MAKSKAIAVASEAPSKPAPKPLTLAAKKLRELKDRKEKIEDDLKTVNKAIKKLESDTIPKLMEDNSMENFKVAGAGTVFLTTEVYSHVNKGDRPKLYAWCRDQGHGDMIGDWIFPNTLKAFVKRQLEDQAENGVNDGNSLPAFVKATLVPTANIRRTK